MPQKSKKASRLWGNSHKEANTRWKEVAFQRVPLYNELIDKSIFIKEGNMMDKEWERLYEEAMSVLNPHDVSNKMWVGSVASAVLTKKGNIYKGICIDTDGSIGMCAERNALSTMLTYGESEIKKVVSVYKDGNIIPSCGICREFMMHLGGDVENIEILLDKEGRTIKLIDLMPEYPRHK